LRTAIRNKSYFSFYLELAKYPKSTANLTRQINTGGKEKREEEKILQTHTQKQTNKQKNKCVFSSKFNFLEPPTQFGSWGRIPPTLLVYMELCRSAPHLNFSHVPSPSNLNL
jgi:hypothetical protein